ncbi:MAG: hypothetical protein ABI808_15170, partial [Pseudonocardiales bacterium]
MWHPAGGLGDERASSSPGGPVIARPAGSGRGLVAFAVAMITLAGCTTAAPQAPPAASTAAAATSAASTSTTTSPTPAPEPTTTSPTPAPEPTTTSPTPAPPPRPKTTPAPPLQTLPRGGRRLLPDYRVIAYYGGPDGPELGVLGSADPDTIAATIEARAAQFATFGRRIQPAMELIATVARPCNADYPLCSGAIPDEAIQSYLDAAHRHKLLLVLDFQPGRGEFLPQVQAVEDYLKDPSVSVALDPEWKL